MRQHLWQARDEYLCKEKSKGAPRPSSGIRSCGLSNVDRGGFPFDGHRDSSLYRNTEDGRAGLTKRCAAAVFSLSKYSNSPIAGAMSPGRCA